MESFLCRLSALFITKATDFVSAYNLANSFLNKYFEIHTLK